MTNYRFMIVKKDKERLYVFPDNTDRSNGSYSVPDSSNYSMTFGKTDLKRTSKGDDCIRGLNNALPLTLIKKATWWEDKDFDEFKKIIDEDVERIKKACVEHGYTEIMFPGDGLLNKPNYGWISIIRTPKLYAYIIEKEFELKKFEPKEKCVEV